MSDKPSRVSIVLPPPPPEKGSFRIEKREDGIMIATPTKAGKMAVSPSHVHEPYAKQWLPLNDMDPDNTSVISKLSNHSNTLQSPSLTAGSTHGPVTTTGPFGTGTFLPSINIKMTSVHAKTTSKTTPKASPPPPAPTTTPTRKGGPPPPLPSNSGNDMNQLLQLLLNNKVIKLPNDALNEDCDKPRCDAKRGRDLCDKASEGLPSNERCELKHSAAQQCLKLLRRKSDDYSWGSVLNAIATSNGDKSLL